MAEERLIDDDKDRKYRIRINENGEEELVIIDDVDEEEDDTPFYDVVTDDEEELSETEIAQKLEVKRQNNQRKAENFKATARRKMEEGDFESAQYALSQASEFTEYDGELYYLQLKAYSRGMTNFLELQKCLDAAEGVREYSNNEQKSELKSLSEPLKERIAQFEEQCDTLKEQSEQGKAERRETFVNAARRALIIFACTLVPFIALSVVAIVFSMMMSSDLSGIYVVLTIAFSIAAVVALFINIFTFYRFWTANRKVKLNEMDTATKVGREYLSRCEELENLKKIYSLFENDIS